MKKTDKQTDYESLADGTVDGADAGTPPVPLQLPDRRQGDRGSPDDAATLPTYVRFADLVAAGIVRNRANLARMINEQNFPPGVLLGKNSRAWLVSEVRGWLARLPSERKVVAPRRTSEQQPQSA